MSPRDDGLERTRDGDLVEPAEHDCDDGWTETAAGRPRPCATCRPDTAARLQDQRDRAARDWIPLAALRRRIDTPPEGSEDLP
jgi:hypothetical protein